jgi:glycosyl hydrolase family 106( putative alpha-L-rhamnosidase)
MGSAVDEAEITRQLQLFQAAGIGGVEISPIDGVTGEQARFIPFLSPRWIDMLRHTVRQARRLGMDVDLLCGAGWPLGGPWVRAEDAPARVLFESYIVAEGDYDVAPFGGRYKDAPVRPFSLAFRAARPGYVNGNTASPSRAGRACVVARGVRSTSADATPSACVNWSWQPDSTCVSDASA